MAREIDYYFTATSPWSYLGHDRAVALAAKHGATLNFKPVNLPPVFAETGGLPLPKRAPARRAYRMMELQRWREVLNKPLVLEPKGLPFDPALADKVAIAVGRAGGDVAAHLSRAFAAVWEQELNLGEESNLAALIGAAGLDPAAVLADAKSEAVEALYAANVKSALAHGVFGAPTFILDGELFWGQDRIDLLARALETGRPAYRA